MKLLGFIKSKLSNTTEQVSVKKELIDKTEISEAFQFNKHELPEGIPLGDIILLWWSNDRLASCRIPNYFVDKYQIKANNEIYALISKGFLRYATPFESLDSFKVPELKAILKTFDKKASGKKYDLINRIKSSILENELPSVKSYKLTLSGELLTKKYRNVIWGHLNSSIDDSVNAFTFEKNLEVDPISLAIGICERKFIDHLKDGDFGLARNSLYCISTYKNNSINELLQVFCFDISGLHNGTKYGLYLYWHGIAPGIISLLKKQLVQNEISDVMIQRMIKRNWDICYTMFPCSIVNDSTTVTKLLFETINDDLDAINKTMELLYKSVPSKFKPSLD